MGKRRIASCVRRVPERIRIAVESVGCRRVFAGSFHTVDILERPASLWDQSRRSVDGVGDTGDSTVTETVGGGDGFNSCCCGDADCAGIFRGSGRWSRAIGCVVDGRPAGRVSERDRLR